MGVLAFSILRINVLCFQLKHKMSPVWRPVEDPPCLDKFCHLSLDAQRVMGAIFEDFKSRKRELLQSTTSREYSVTSRHNNLI